MYVLHNRVKETLAEVQRKCWIVKGRSLTRAILFRYAVCKRYEGAALNGPPPPPLPEFRVREEPAYTYTGVDFAGPLFVQSRSSDSSYKVWICLFNCLVTRAVHLDIVSNLLAHLYDV